MKKSRHKLSNKLIIGFVLLGILIFVANVITSYTKYRADFERLYNDVAYRIAAVALSYVDGDAVEAYLETGQTDEAYERMGDYLSAVRENMNANYIYIAKLEGVDLTYIYDADNPDDDYPPFKLGDRGTINPDFEEEAYEIVTKGIRSDNYFYSKSQFGYNTSAIVPIYNSKQKIVAILGVEVAMETLQNTLLEFIIFTAVASALLIAIFIAIYLKYLQSSLVAPIRLMTDEANSFIKNETQISENLKTITTGDEIEQLAAAILKMEIDIKEYIENITLIMAEKERIGAELNVATQIQSSMLPCIFPPFPEIPEFDIYATMEPAKEVGGDFYDFFLLDDRQLAFVVADVSGKGIPAALFMVITKTLIKNQAQAGSSAKDIFTIVNSQLCENNEANMFVTAWMGIYDIDSGKLTYVNAGHNPPLLRNKNGKYEYLKSKTDFVLGGMKGIKYQQNEIYLNQGDSLFLYTDGVTEATDSSMELYGEARLQNTLNAEGYMPPLETIKAVADDINLFVGEAPQFDDITMLAIKITEHKEASITVQVSIDNLEKVFAFVDPLLDQSGCPKKIKAQFHIVIDELFSNISYYSESKSVSISCAADSQGAEITFTDRGVPYNPFESEDPDVSLSAEEREEGGLGVYITKKLMDKITYDFLDNKNIVTIYKKYDGGLH